MFGHVIFELFPRERSVRYFTSSWCGVCVGGLYNSETVLCVLVSTSIYKYTLLLG